MCCCWNGHPPWLYDFCHIEPEAGSQGKPEDEYKKEVAYYNDFFSNLEAVVDQIEADGEEDRANSKREEAQ